MDRISICLRSLNQSLEVKTPFLSYRVSTMCDFDRMIGDII